MTDNKLLQELRLNSHQVFDNHSFSAIHSLLYRFLPTNTFPPRGTPKAPFLFCLVNHVKLRFLETS